MASIIADLLVKLGVDTSRYAAGIKSAADKTKKFKLDLKALGKAGALALAAGAVAAGKEFIEAQDAAIRLAGTLKGIRGTSLQTAISFDKMATALSKKGGFSDDEIMDAMNKFLILTKDVNRTMDAMPGILNMAATPGNTLETSTLAVAKAFNGSSGALTKYGVKLAESAEGMEVLTAVDKVFAGQQAASSKTFGTKTKDIGNAIKNFGEDLVGNTVNLIKNKEEMKGLENGTIKMTEAWKGAIATHQIVDEAMDKTAEESAELQAAFTKEQEKMAQTINDTVSVLGPMMATVTATLLDANATINEKLGAILKAGLMAVLDVISLQIKAYIALEVTKAIGTGGLTAGTIAATSAQLIAIEGLKAAVGTISLADGGIASRPVNAIVGDSSSPEVIAPLHKLQPMITRAVNNSQSNKMTFVINSNGLDNARDIVRKQIVPELDNYFRKRGRSFYGAY